MALASDDVEEVNFRLLGTKLVTKKGATPELHAVHVLAISYTADPEGGGGGGGLKQYSQLIFTI